MGVGGSFDVIEGKTSRAPLWMIYYQNINKLVLSLCSRTQKDMETISSW